MENNDLEEAKRNYFNYDGNEYYMGRDGINTLIKDLGATEENKKEWLAELKIIRPLQLKDDGSYRVIAFLNNHKEYQYLSKILAIKPLGSQYNRVLYLMELYSYFLMTPERKTGSYDEQLYTYIDNHIKSIRSEECSEDTIKYLNYLEKGIEVLKKKNN